MKPAALGTIFTTPAQLDAADKVADKLRAAALRLAAHELDALEYRTVDSEPRYYATPTIYTPAIKRGNIRRWFEVRADGDYSITYHAGQTSAQLEELAA